ncbi:MAG: hypothetical protein ACTSRS_19405 [Candidatus Helarchaeota archaeon]
MEKLEKTLVKKEKEIEKLKQKLKEQEEKQKRDQSRLKEEIKELEARVKELLKEKKDMELGQEQAVLEKDAVLKQLGDLQEENKRLHEDLAQVGVLKAEITGLKLRIENQVTGINEMEQMLASKDEVIDQLRASEIKLREEIRQKNEEIAKRESLISVMKSGKLNVEQSLEQAEEKVKSLNTELTSLKTSLMNRDAQITQLNDKIQTLEKEKATLSHTIETKESEIAQLKSEIQTLNNQLSTSKDQITQLQSAIEAAEAGIISDALPNLVKGDTQAAEKIAQIAQRIKSNAILSIPEFEAVPSLINIDKLRPSTRLRIMSYVDFNNPKHKAIFTQISRPNILIRHSEERNLWGINRDHEELLIAPRDASGTPTGLVVKDPFQIEILGNILLEIWGKCRRNVDQYSFPD